MTEPRHMTITEVEEKLATMDAAHESAVKAQEASFTESRVAALERLSAIRKEGRAGMAKKHQANRAKLAAYLDVLKLEGE